jgi:molybdopterin-biosynthesis enzyme MoeA-like protein
MNFGLYIIGDEILSGKREDKHFSAVVEMLGKRGLRLSWVSYLGDDRERLCANFRRTLAGDEVVFSCGGIGNTPDDHTRQAVAAALGVPTVVHPEGLLEMRARFGDDMTPERLQLVAFPEGATIIPNPFNRIPGFSVGRHWFVPGFPQMAWPMIDWVLDTHYADAFETRTMVDKALLLTGPNAYESALLDLMERIVMLFPDLRLFSLPSIGPDKERRHLELGVEGEPDRVDQAMEMIRVEVDKRGLGWRWRD